VKVRDLGATRCGATATVAMLDEYRRRATAEAQGHTASPGPGGLGGGGY
jgi:deoxyribose-phosphate aldolase